MKALTEKGKVIVHDLAIRYGISLDAVNTLLQAVIYGHGTQAQFNIPELGGMGQWMKGGMIMVGDMLNHSLKNTVDNICKELSALLNAEDVFIDNTMEKKKDFFGSGTWWPSEYGNPSSSGSQNNVKYAYFGAPVQRLVVETDGKRTIYDTLNYQISGISQQQGSNQSLSFSSQKGPVNIKNLPLIADPENETETEDPELIYTNANEDIVGEYIATPLNKDDIFTTIEKLGVLLQKDLISREEFENKKSELLKKL